LSQYGLYGPHFSLFGRNRNLVNLCIILEGHGITKYKNPCHRVFRIQEYFKIFSISGTTIWYISSFISVLVKIQGGLPLPHCSPIASTAVKMKLSAT
jgi:hypothetical protein